MKLDQHFLIDDHVAKSAVALCDIKKEDDVVEIGPGHGELTKFIPECRLVLIEKDGDLARNLKKRYERIIQGEGIDEIKYIKFDFLISSVPYSISEPLIRQLFIHDFKKAVLILPANFVDNLEAKDSSLSFLANEFLEIRKVEFVERVKFDPKPRVDSYVVEFKKKKGNKILEEICLQKDKKVKNALREAVVRIQNKTKNQAREIVDNWKINENTLTKNVKMLSYHELTYLKEVTK